MGSNFVSFAFPCPSFTKDPYLYSTRHLINGTYNLRPTTMAPHAENGVNGSSSGGLDFTKFSNVIDGKLSSTSKTRHGINPATDKPNPEVPVSTPEDVDRAVEAAKKVSKAWGKVSYADRRKAVLAFADALEKEKDGFARMLTKEQGKPVS